MIYSRHQKHPESRCYFQINILNNQELEKTTLADISSTVTKSFNKDEVCRGLHQHVGVHFAIPASCAVSSWAYNNNLTLLH